MRFIRQLFSRDEPKTPATSRMFSQYPSDMSQPARKATPEESAARRELLRSVLRKTMNRYGIPADWLAAETLIATSRGRETGVHWRLLVKHWDPRLMKYAVTLQNTLTARVLSDDPLAAEWLTGISWQFALPEGVECPQLPHAGYWTAEPRPANDEPTTEPLTVSGGAVDVIAGPVRIASQPAPLRPPQPDEDSSDSLKSDLDKLMAIRDAELARNAQLYGSPDATQPMYLRTEPQPLEDPPRPDPRTSRLATRR